MKAVVRNTYGSPDVLELEEIDKPDLADDGGWLRRAATDRSERRQRRAASSIINAKSARAPREHDDFERFASYRSA